MKFCPSCGAKKLREQDRFCMNCGEPYPLLPEEETTGPATEQPAQADSLFEQPAAEAPAAEVPAADTAFPAVNAPASAPAQQDASVAHVQPSRLAAQAESSRGPAESSRGPAENLFEQPAPQQPAQFQPVEPPAPQPPEMPAQIQPEILESQPESLDSQPESLFEEPVAQAPVQQAPAVSVPNDVEAEAASLRDSIDKMLGGETPQQVYEPAQPENLFAPEVLEESGPQYTPYEAPVFEEPEAVFEGAPQYDEYGNPLGETVEENLFEPAAPADNTLGFGVVEGNAAGDSLFEEPAQNNENLFANAPTPRQQHSEPRRNEPVFPKKQRYEELNRAVEQAAGPDTEKWQRLQQDNIQDLYAKEERKQRPPEIQLPEYDEKKSKKRKSGGGGRTVGIIIVAVVVFVIGTLGATMGLLYYRNSPSKAIDAFIENIEDGNYTALNNSVELVGVEGTTDGWAAFCNAFESASAKRDLQNQLKNQAKKGATASDEYPAVVMEGEPLFLFVKRYYIKIEAIDLLAEGIFDAQPTINGLFLYGDATDAGLLFSGFMPGRYEYQIYYDGGELVGEIDAFATEGANRLVGGGAVANPDDEQPQQETPELGNSETGEGEAGETPESQPEEPAVNEDLQRAENMSASDLNAVLETYYRSYLTSINDQTTDTLKNSTGANTTAMASRITAENNASNIFEYVSVNVDASSIQASENKVVFNAAFSYKYTPRDGGDTQDGGNNQKVTMVYEDGEWRVSGMEFITD